MSARICKMYLPNSLETIDGRAFNYSQLDCIRFEDGSNFEILNSSLVNKKTKTLVIGGASGIIAPGIEHIGDYAFFKNLAVTEISIPASTKTIGSHAFANCHNVQSIAIEKTGSQLLSVGAYAFAYCYEVKELSLPDCVQSIGNGAFSSLRKITRFIFPSQAQIKVIGGSMFYGCESLNEIILPESVEEIDEDAFANCHSLTEIVLPKSVKKIHGDAFRDCTNLKRVIADTEAMWEVKKYIGTSVQVDSLYTNTAEQFAKSLSSNTIATTYFGSAYTKFIWYLV